MSTSDARNDDTDRRLAWLVRELAPRGAEAGGCPEDNLLCGFAEGRLAGAEQTAVQSHVAGCETCRGVVAQIANLQPLAARRRPALRWIGLAAAVLVVGVAVVVARAVLGGGSASTDERLAAAVRALAAELPDRFADFQPLTRDERLAQGSTERGAGVPLHPSQRILATRPTFRWEAEPHAASFEIVLRTADGVVLWRATTEGSELPFPAEQPDLQSGQRYIWQLVASGALGKSSPASRLFEIADGASRRDLEAALQVIEARSPPGLSLLLRAHFALRQGFLEAAEAASRAAFAASPQDPVARETLFRVLNVLGASEAEGLRPPPAR